MFIFLNSALPFCCDKIRSCFFEHAASGEGNMGKVGQKGNSGVGDIGTQYTCEVSLIQNLEHARKGNSLGD